MKLQLQAGDEVILRAREDIKAGEEIGRVRRPFNAAAGQWEVTGKYLIDRRNTP